MRIGKTIQAIALVFINVPSFSPQNKQKKEKKRKDFHFCRTRFVIWQKYTRGRIKKKKR